MKNNILLIVLAIVIICTVYYAYNKVEQYPLLKSTNEGYDVCSLKAQRYFDLCNNDRATCVNTYVNILKNCATRYGNENPCIGECVKNLSNCVKSRNQDRQYCRHAFDHCVSCAGIHS
jgi:hypothetical protein